LAMRGYSPTVMTPELHQPRRSLRTTETSD
jgi:hypothetical protein